MTRQTFNTHSETETKQIAADLAAKLSPFLSENKIVLILLEGDFGVGKTQFVKGLGKALGVEEHKITSPSYTYMAEHVLQRKSEKAGEQESKNPMHKLVHFDAWRIKTAETLELTGFGDYLIPGNIVVVEWGDSEAINQNSKQNIQNLVRIQIKFQEIDENTRQITIESEL